MEKQSSALNRRSFLDYLLGSGVVALLGSVFFPVLKYIMPPAIPLVRLSQRPFRFDRAQHRRPAATAAGRVPR